MLEREADVVERCDVLGHTAGQAIRQACARHVDADSLEAAGAQLTRLHRVEALAREDVQRAAVVVAEHARDGEPVAGGHRVDDLAAFAHAQALVRPGRRDPDAVLGVEADAVGERVLRRRGRPTLADRSREPSAPIVNAVSRPPNDSPTMSVEPSGVITMPFGNAMSSAATRCEPSRSTASSDRVDGVVARVEVEAERADVRGARRAHDHVVDRMGGVADERSATSSSEPPTGPTDAADGDRPSTRSAARRPDPNRDPTVRRRPRRSNPALRSVDRTRARRCACMSENHSRLVVPPRTFTEGKSFEHDLGIGHGAAQYRWPRSRPEVA